MKLPRPGELFEGQYTIVDTLGEGGFAVVLRALDRTGQTVALKILKPEREGYSLEIQSRFTREVRVLAGLRDPHNVRMVDSGRSTAGLLFMVFEYIPGRDLSEVLDEVNRLDPALVVRLIRQIASGLQEAHQKNLLHRDIKPANVRIFEYAGDPWRVKLLDFGIARPLVGGEAANITKTGELIGTPRYMSPEQLMGGMLGPPSDIYSLGLLGLEMLMGSNALASNSWGAQIDRLQTGYQFSIPQMERAGIGLVSVIQRMLARRAEDRFQSVDHLLAALDAFERGEPIPPSPPQRHRPPPSTTSQSIEQAARSQPIDTASASQSMETQTAAPPRRLMVIAGVLVALVATMGGLAAYLAAESEEPPTPRPRTRPLPFATSNEPQPAPVEIMARDLGVDAPGGEDAEFAFKGCRGERTVAGGRTELSDLGLPYEGVVYVPRKYSPKKQYPLVVAFHELLQNPVSFLAQTELEKSAEERGYILVVPMGDTTRQPWVTLDQVEHIKGVVDSVRDVTCIDGDRIFLIGHGSGGLAAEFLSCEGWASAIVTVSYRPSDALTLCPAPPIRHLQFHAMRSQRMPLEGGKIPLCAHESKLSLAGLEKHWQERNHCSTREKDYRVERTGRCVSFACEAELVSCRLKGGHGFPGGTNESPINLICDDPPADFPAREVIFDFLDAHPKD